MLDVHLTNKALLDLGWWIKNDIKSLKKIFALLENICKNPFDGIGQPEPLKSNYKGYWSRRINLEHRIIYKIESEKIVIISFYGHYQ